MKFIMFQTSGDTARGMFINPSLIAAMTPHPDEKNITIIWLTGVSDEFWVNSHISEVLEQLYDESK